MGKMTHWTDSIRILTPSLAQKWLRIVIGILFFRNSNGSCSVAISTARAGNVIGGGDFCNDRIIPDCVRAILSAKDKGMDQGIIGVRYPYSTRISACY
jgi:hypothetical protein